MPPEACIDPAGDTLSLRKIYDVLLRPADAGIKRFVEVIISTKPAAKHCAVVGAAGAIALRASAGADIALQVPILREFDGGKYSGYFLPAEEASYGVELGWADGRESDGTPDDAPFQLQLNVDAGSQARSEAAGSAPPQLCTSLSPSLPLVPNGRWIGSDWAPFRCYLAPYSPALMQRCAVGPPLHVLVIGNSPMREVFTALGGSLSGKEWEVQYATIQATSRSADGMSLSLGSLRISWVRWGLRADGNSSEVPSLPSFDWLEAKSSIIALVGSNTRGSLPASKLLKWAASLGFAKLIWVTGVSELSDPSGGCDEPDCTLSPSRRQLLAATDAETLGASLPIFDVWKLGGAGRPASVLCSAVASLLVNAVCNPRLWPHKPRPS